MATTPPCPCWRRARRSSAACADVRVAARGEGAGQLRGRPLGRVHCTRACCGHCSACASDQTDGSGSLGPWALQAVRPRQGRAPPSRLKPCGGSTLSSTSSAASTARRLSRASPCGRRTWRPWSPTSKPGCAGHAARCRATSRSPKAMDHMLRRWDTFSRFLGNGHICLSNNAAERALRGIAFGRKAGCSREAIAAATGRRPCTRSSPQQS